MYRLLQWLPRGTCIPACTGQGGFCPWGVCTGGCFPRGIQPMGCLPAGVCPAGGRWVLPTWACPSGGMWQTVNRMTNTVKHYLAATSLRTVITKWRPTSGIGAPGDLEYAHATVVNNLRIRFNLSVQTSNLKSNLPSLDLNHSKILKLILCRKMFRYFWYFSEVSTCPSGQVTCKSTCPEAIFTRHGRADEC